MDAILLVDKPKGLTSFDLIREVRRKDRSLKVGHTGSLDPFATGVVVLLLGRATKFSQVLMSSEKQYVAELELGRQTDTGDWTGETISQRPVPLLKPSQVEASFNHLVGKRLQRPPAFSAKKVGGKKAYEEARKGRTLTLPLQAIEIHSLRLVCLRECLVQFYVHCSKGTYVRTLAEEIAHGLDTVGHLRELRRTSNGEFRADQSLVLDELFSNWEQHLETGQKRYLKVAAQASYSVLGGS